MLNLFIPKKNNKRINESIIKNKERLITMTNVLQTIANNYLCIDDTGFMERGKPDDDFTENTETEEQLMNDIWSNYIDHLYERDRMLFSHLFVKKIIP